MDWIQPTQDRVQCGSVKSGGFLSASRKGIWSMELVNDVTHTRKLYGY
jgi:hypothetical protein